MNRLCILLMSVFLLGTIGSVQAQLSGSYTINASGSGSKNYKTFAAAVSALNSSGVSGPVVFNVAFGTYTEQVTLNYVSGSSSSNTIKFKGTDSSRVVLQYNCSQYDAVVKVNAAANFAFEGMTIKSTNNTYGYGVHITSSAENISLSNMVIEVASRSGVNVNCIPINVAGVTYATQGDNGDDISVSNSVIKGGYFGVNIRGVSNSLLSENFTFKGNSFEGQYYYGIYAAYTSDLVVEDCIIDDLILYYAYGIYTNQCSGTSVIGNKIYPGRFGVYFYLENYYNRSDSCVVINNEIADFADPSYNCGVFASAVFNLRAYHNTINIGASVSNFTYSCMYLSQPYNHIVLNNNFLAEGNSTVLYLGSGTLGSTKIDYNNYYSVNSGLINWQGTTYNDIASLQAAVSSQNQNSVNEDPGFAASRTLVPTTSGLNNSGFKNLASKDLNGKSRPKAPDTTPDMGAYEYYISPNDIDLIAIPKPIIAKTGNNEIGVVLKNNGSASYKDTVFLQYRINTGSWVKDTAVYADFKVGTTDTFKFKKQWNITSSGTYSVCVFVDPGILGDPDSLVGDTICDTKCVGRSGTFVIDGTGSGDYKTFAAAISSLSCGIAGPIKFTVKPGTYSERLTIGEILGASSTNTVTFEGTDRDKVIIKYTGTSSDPAVILLDDADYITLKNLSIINDGAQVANGVWMREEAHDNTVENCYIELDSTKTVYSICGVLVANAVSSSSTIIPGNTSSNILIKDNKIVGGSHGIRINGTGRNTTSSNLRLINNSIRNFYYQGITCGYISESLLRGNTIRTARLYTGMGLSMYYCNKDSIDNNVVEGGRYGMYIYYENQYNRNNFTAISNNMISNLLDPNYQIGLYASLGYNLSIYHNSIWTDQSFSSAFYAAMTLYYGNNCFVKNNSIKSSNGGMCYSQYYGSISIGAVDYNNYYATGAAKFYHNGLTFTDLSTWKAVNTQFNQNSEEGDPNYNSMTDLHATGSQLNNEGVKGLGVTKDIDGHSRPFSPDKKVDIGADEYYVSPYDIDLTKLDSPIVPLIGSNKIRIHLQNNGVKGLSDDTVVVSYDIDGVLSSRDTIVIDTLAPASSLLYTFKDDWKISTAKTYQLCARLDTVFLPDPDSLTKQRKCDQMCPGAKGAFTIDPSGNGDFKTFRGALNALNCGISGPITFTVKNGTYNERIVLNEILGASNSYPINFVGESRKGVSLNYTGAFDSMEVIDVEGGDYYHFSNMTVKNASRIYSRGVRISEQADYNTFTNISFDIPTNANNSYCMSVYISDEGLGTSGNSGNYNEFENCSFVGGYYGARLYGTGSNSPTYGNSFVDCSFKYNRFYGLMAYYQGSMNIDGCVFDSLRASYRNLYLYMCTETQLVNSVLKGGNMGVYMIYENYYFQNETSTIANNQICRMDGTTDNYGMDLYLSYNLKFFHNSIHLGAGTGGSVVRFRNGSGHDVRNNSFSKSTNAELFTNTSSAFTEVDFNNYYVGSSSNFANYNGTSYDDLDKWKSGVSGFNRNSKAGDPGYKDPASDLSVKPKTTQLANWGSITTGITTDYEGDLRNPLNPDVGMDEYTDLYDLGITAVISPATGCELSSTETVSVTVKNLGGIDMPAGELVPLSYQLNGGTVIEDTFLLTTDLLVGNTFNFSFDSKANLSGIKSHALKTWTDLSNDSLRTNDTLSRNISSNEIPKPNFSITGFCSNEDIQFSNSSSIGTGSITGYSWDFGNGKSGSSASGKTDYASTGSYTIKLVVESDKGCKDSVSKSLNIEEKPTASYTSSKLCLGDSTVFTNTSSIAATVGVSFTWAFGDTKTGSGVNVKHLYASSGTYTAQLIAESVEGCKDSSSNSVVIAPNPTASFTRADVCKGDSARFTNTTVAPLGFTPSYSWTYGDGNSGTKKNPAYLYGAIGKYQVSLTASLTNGCSSTYTRDIDVYSKPQPSFAVADGCDGDSIAYVDGSAIQLDTIDTYDWAFGDTKTSTATSPKHLYSGPGSYSVKLILTSVKGCKDSLSKTVDVNEAPVSTFSVSNECNGDSSAFSNSSSITTGTISSYEWTYGDGFSSSATSPKHLYANSGTYSVQLVSFSNEGCSDTSIKSTTVHATPTADFAVSNVCFGDNLSPTNNSSISGGTIASYNWDFDDGSTSTSTSPTHKYTSKGTYDIELIATSTQGCKDTLSKQVVVDNVIVPGFSATSVCQGINTEFSNSTNTSCGVITDYLWRFGNGKKSTLENPKHLYTSAGTYSVTLVVTKQGNVKDSVTKSITVNANPSTGFSLSNSCENVGTSFTNSSSIGSGSISSREWSFGDGNKSGSSSPSHTYLSDGNYTVKLVNTSDKGCKDSTSKSITIYDQPSSDFSFSSACLGQAVNFTNSTSIGSGTLSYVWKFGDGFSSTQKNPKYTYSVSGTYTVTLIATSGNGCIDSVQKTLVIDPSPTAAFTANDECSNVSTTFSNTSTISAGTLSYFWDFGDNTNSTSISPSHKYGTPGSYSVKLVITSNKGCKDSVTKTVRSLPAPVANFTVPSPCSGTKLTFSNASSVPSGTMTYKWSFGDGNSSTSTSPTHTYTTTGNYTVKLVTTASTGGCVDSVSKSASVYDLPTASFSTTGTCLADSIEYGNTSSIASGTMTYAWDLGDGTKSTDNSIKHKYTSSGTYQVKLVVTSNWGCQDSSTQTVTISPSPTVGFSTNDVCLGTQSDFTNTSSIGTGTLSYFWDFDNSFASTATNPSLTYGKRGTYNVKLITTTSKGCKDSVTKAVEVYENPVARFAHNSTCLNDSTIFQSTSSISSGTLNNYWDFDDGNTSLDKNTKNRFAKTGSYLVELVVTSNNGCRDTLQKQVIINPQAEPRFIAANACFGDDVSFKNNSTLSSGSFTNSWDFDDGNSSGLQSPDHFYKTPGTYDVELRLTTDSGCVARLNKVVVVNTKPVADFNVANVCKNDSAQFNNTSTIGAGKVVGHSWSFGDGFQSTNASPKHLYATYGSFSAELISASDSGCTDTISKTLDVFAQPVAAFSASNVCFGDTLFPTNNSTIASGSISSHNWNFGDGNTSNTSSPFNFYSSKGSYDVKLVTTSNNGCKDSVVQTVKVDNIVVPDFNAQSVCIGNAMAFTNTTNASCGNITSYQWSFGDGKISSSTNPTHSYSSAGAYNVRLIVVQKGGARDTVIKTVSVHPKPTVSFNVRDTCAGSSALYSNTSSITTGSITGYTWHFGDGVKSSNTSPSHTYNAHGSYLVKLVATSNEGCADSTTYNSLSIHELPQTAFNFDAGCLYDDVVFTNKSFISSGSLVYSWNYGDGNSGGGTNPDHSYSSPGAYSVTLSSTSSKGCVASLTQSVFVNHTPSASFAVDTVCEGNVNTFSSNSSIGKGSIASYAWKFGDGFNGSGSAATHTYANYGSYNSELVVVSDSGCSDTIKAFAGVNPVPASAFTANNVCFGDKLIPNNTSSLASGSITKWDWDFDDGNSSTDKSPEHTYSTKGTYTVALTATSDKGCTHTYSQKVEVDNTTAAGFTTGSDVCLGDTMFFTNTTSTSCGTINGYQWKFGDATSATSKDAFRVYTASGTYTVELIVSLPGGEKDTAKVDVTVLPKPKANFFASNACEGTQVQFQNLSTISSGAVASNVWNFGNGNKSSDKNPKYTYTSSGAFDVSLTSVSDKGCVDSVSKSITIYELPTVDFSANDVCDDESVTFSNGSSIGTGSMNYSWSFGDGFSSSQTSPVYKYAKEGTYTVELKVTSDKFCVATLSKNVKVFEVPSASFTLSDTCENDDVPFNNTSSINSGSLGYTWTYGDGNSSNLTSPTHVYAGYGNYDVKLRALSNNGCADSVTQQISIFEKANASFSYTAGCPGESVDFSSTTSSSRPIAGLTWDLDGTTTSTNAPSFTFSGAGPHKVVLYALTVDNCIDTAQGIVQFQPVPAVDFTFNQICERDTARFNNLSTLSAGTMNYLWRFGDGTTSSGTSPSKFYALDQPYDITLVATTDKGCEDSLTQTIVPLDKPEVKFSAKGGCLGDSTTFINSTAQDVSNQYTWHFGDAGASTSAYNASYKYPAIGSYVATLTVNNGNCVDSMQQTIKVGEGPQNLDFSFSNTCARSIVNFNNLTTNSNLTYLWQFFDGTFSTQKNPQKFYAEPGQYAVGFKASEGDCADSTFKTITIYPYADSSFNFTALGNRSVKFEPNDTTTLSYAWNFGDGNTSAAYAPTHTYGADGTYTVTLNVTTADGCTNTSTRTVTIKGNSVFWNDEKNLTFAAYPNPFNQFVIASFEILEESDVQMVVYDEMGREVKRLDKNALSAGNYQMTIIDDTNGLNSGMYYLRVVLNGEHALTQKLLLAR